MLAIRLKKDTETQFCWIYCLKYVTCLLHYPTLNGRAPENGLSADKILTIVEGPEIENG